MDYLKKKRQSNGKLVQPEPNAVNGERSLQEIFNEAESVIRTKLKALCPEYQLQEKGYRLPVPRLRRTESDRDIDDIDDRHPRDILEVLATKSAVVITLPATYPDDSIPWVIADHLLANSVGDAQILPIVIDGNAMAPPRNSLASLSSPSVPLIDEGSGVQVVYVIDGLPLSSRIKMNFIRGEIKARSEAKFIYICKNESRIVEITEFANEQSADLCRLCPVSFHDIALFLQKNFSMSSSEAEVVAFRLNRTFNRFELAAHPTYFAGIPKETLAALLQANRRSELIQLAVDGFLTFVVADDKADISLSRTTRSRFLRKLVVQLNVEKMSFSQSELVAFTQDFSKLYDFAIDPLKFIQAFVDKGIIHFDAGDNVRFSLPFVEKYLLASELSQDNILAEKYYDFNATDFDFNSFDIYCEIGAADVLVGKYLALTDNLIAQYGLQSDEEHLLISGNIHPVMLGSQDRLQVLHKKVAQAQDDIKNNRGDTKSKQRMIDMIDHVKEKVAEESRLEAEQPDEQFAESHPPDHQNLHHLQHAIGVWAVGVIILGSGAEHLTGKTKQNITKSIVRLGSALTHHWTSVHAAIDFAKMKRELATDENVLHFFRSNGKHPEDLVEAKKFIETMVDVIEYYMLSQPMRRTLEYLCEQARQRVLAESVAKPSFEHPMEKILHSAWLTDIESGRGKDALYDAIRALPPATFLRINLASHFLTRVHWSQWRKDDRLLLLDMAVEAIKPLDVSIKKGELKRAIEKEAAEKKRDVEKKLSDGG
ncbi:hypothetical protein [Rhizobium sp. NZLR11]|uniref:STAND family AAA ATPase n=1 Tax=Rhizobium sp. NZLR11 TaxID=2731098 RepID=UPI001C8324A3|nr:hypothetical protein [Rhizobium sp. NZLR11]MBX5210863.1 hypothetical protein [Rhizobium sp. NZLR11]